MVGAMVVLVLGLISSAKALFVLANLSRICSFSLGLLSKREKSASRSGLIFAISAKNCLRVGTYIVSGWYSPSIVMTLFMRTMALSAVFGVEPCPGVPLAIILNHKMPFSAVCT